MPLGDLDPRDAAPLSDAALTPYHAIKLALPKLAPGTSVLVIGVGGLGHMAVQLVRALSPARSSPSTSTRRSSPSRASSAPTATVQAGEDAAAEIAELTGGRGADARPRLRGQRRDARARRRASSRRGGSVMVIGVAGGTLPLTFGTMRFDASITYPYWGSAVELAEVLELARAGHIQRARRALPARASRRRVPAHARGLARGAGGDHAQRLGGRGRSQQREHLLAEAVDLTSGVVEADHESLEALDVLVGGELLGDRLRRPGRAPPHP